MALDIDSGLLEEFEHNLDPRDPERSLIPARVLGYGEISTVFEIGHEEQRDTAYKRMPIFRDPGELVGYEKAFNEYIRLLEILGLTLPEYGYATVTAERKSPVFFIAQRKLDPESIANKAIHSLPAGEVMRLCREILRELRHVFEYNLDNPGAEIGIDGQISNWSIEGFDPAAGALPEAVHLTYFDTSTPLFRVEGVEQLDPELFLRSAPSFMVWLIRLLFLEDVMTRYYDFHLVATDMVANFYKEQRPELIPDLIDMANEFLAGEAADLGVEPLSVKGVKSYYREDALIWTLYLSMRKTDRFLRTRLLRKGYPYILPGKIKRR